MSEPMRLFTRAEFFQGVLATLVGFLFAVGWDLFKDWRREVKERKRAARLVHDEIEINITLAESIREYLTKDSEAAKEQKLLIPALPTLPTQAWETTRLAGGFSSAPELLREIGGTYHEIAIVNQQIQARELFKLTSQPLDRFNEQRVLMNQELIRRIENILEGLKKHRKQIDGIS